MTNVELVAVLLAVAYLLLAIRENVWCWVCAGASTALYVWLFFEARLYMESVLNVFYFLMAAYGWYVWVSGRSGSHERAVVRWPAAWHGVAIGAVIVASLLSGYLLRTHTDAAYPYIDSMTTWAAIWATFLVARKVLENWWYWLAIDTASIFIYWSRDLEQTAVLFALYVVLIPFGIVAWTRSFREAQQWA